MPATEVILYQDDDEERTVPLLKWFEGQTKKVRVKCQAYLNQLEDFGHELRRPVADYLRDGIYELRPSYQRVHYRILYFFPKAGQNKPAGPLKIVVVSHALVKEGEVPDAEIDRAVERKGKFERNPRRHTFKPTLRG
jgi:phage-related protein